MSIIDHLTVDVSDYARSKTFYEKLLAPLGITLVMEHGPAAGFGKNGKPELWINGSKSSFQTDAHRKSITPVHVALRAESRAEVDAFHAAGLSAGAEDFGAPGLRPVYHAGYYGGFVLDPDGHNVEAVCHRPE